MTDVIDECEEFSCCNNKVKYGDLWILADFKGYTKRKLLIGKCRVCGDDVALQVMTDAATGKTYFNFYTGIEAVKTIYREKKRKIAVLPEIKFNSLYGWIYGHNVQIKNKKGEITQLRQYASDFNQTRKLVKKVITAAANI